MSYNAAAALQSAVYTQLTGWPGLSGVSVVDAIPSGSSLGTFVLIGPEQVLDQSDKTGDGAEHRFDVSVISDDAGFLSAKLIAAEISQALVGASLALSVGSLISVNFLRANARRLDEGAIRRIDLQFRARIEL
jgi:hypothetical protein